jgi:chromosome segregation ATPase
VAGAEAQAGGREAVSKYKKQLEKLKDDHDRLKAKLEEHRQQATEQAAQWEGQRVDLEKRLADKDKAAEKVSVELESWKRQCRVLAGERNIALEDTIRLKSEHDKLTADHAAVSEQLVEVGMQNEELKAEVERVNRYFCGIQSGEVNPIGTKGLLREWQECAKALSEFAPKAGKSYRDYQQLLAKIE